MNPTPPPANPICFSCGHPMVDPAYYEQHPEQFAELPKFTHAEHIIHNALHGRLKSNNILCKECGSTFGHEADGEFVHLFTPITARLRDRLLPRRNGQQTISTLQGILYEGGDPSRPRRVELRDGVVTPKEPFYTFDQATSQVTLYASKVRAGNYQKVVEKELTARGVALAGLTFQMVTNMQDLGLLSLFFTEGVKNFSERLQLGFNKIALDFAMHAGVPRTQVPAVLEIDAGGRGRLVRTQPLIPYYPLSALDELLEAGRPEMETHYPSHTLILFSQRRVEGGQVLFCYVELFSTFQYYVVLNDDYQGEPVYRSYHQETLRRQVQKVDLRTVAPQDWSIYANDLGIDTSDYPVENLEAYRLRLQKAIDDYYVEPELDLQREVHAMLERVMPLLVTQPTGEAGEPARTLFEWLQAEHPQQWLAIVAELHFYASHEQAGSYRHYKTSIIESAGQQPEYLSYPTECRSIDPSRVQDYSRAKFNQLNDLINEAEEQAARARQQPGAGAGRPS